MADPFITFVVESSGVSTLRIRKALPPDKYNVERAVDPAEAVKMMGYYRPDLIFLSTDYDLRAVYGLCQKLSEHGFPVILLEPKPTRASVIRAMRYGALDVLTAPPPQRMIAPRVRRVLIRTGKILPEVRETGRLKFPSTMTDARRRVEYIILQAKTLMALPHAVSTVMRLSSRPDTSASDLVVPIQADAAITASIFRHVNSAAMGNAQRVTELKMAIARLGMKTTANMALTHSVFDMFEKDADTFGFDRTQFWIHSLAAACCARALITICDGVDPDDAFLAGLLHDLGKMILDQYMPTEYQQILQDANLEGIPIRKGESQVLKIGHTYVGNRIGSQWELPSSLCDSVGDHHKYNSLVQLPPSATGDNGSSFQTTRCVCFANQMAKALRYGHAGDFIVESDAIDLWQSVERRKLDLPQLHERILKELKGFINMLQIRPKELNLGDLHDNPEAILLCFSENDPGYEILMAAFFARLGFPVTVCTSLENVPGNEKEYVLTVTKVSGSVDDAKQAAEKLIPFSSGVIVLSDCTTVGREGAELGKDCMAIRHSVDFNFLYEQVHAILLAHETQDSA